MAVYTYHTADSTTRISLVNNFGQLVVITGPQFDLAEMDPATVANVFGAVMLSGPVPTTPKADSDAFAFAQTGVVTTPVSGTDSAAFTQAQALGVAALRVETAAATDLATLAAPWGERHRIAIASSPTQTAPATTASRFNSVVSTMNSSNRTWAASLHGTRPSLRMLGYQEGPYTRGLLVPANGNTSDGHSGVSEEQAVANSWRMRNSGGALITNQVVQLPDNLIDVGNSAVRTAWSLNSRTRALAGSPATQDFQGIWADDINYDLSASATAYPTTPTAYATNAAWWTAQQGMFSTIYSDFTGAGLELMANLGSWQTGNAASINGILPYVSGALHEFFTLYGFATDAWSGWYHNDLGVMDSCVAAGKRFYAQVHGSTTNARFGYASFLLAAHATNSSLQSIGYSGTGQDYTNEYWITEFEYPIGAPIETRVEIGGNATGFNAFRRYYSNGVALVNPKYNTDGSTRASNVTFSLDRNYVGSGFTATNAVTLAPGLGAVMYRA